MKAINYRNRHFPTSIIQRAVWLYTRFTLSLLDVEELLAGRDIFKQNRSAALAELRQLAARERSRLAFGD